MQCIYMYSQNLDCVYSFMHSKLMDGVSYVKCTSRHSRDPDYVHFGG